MLNLSLEEASRKYCCRPNALAGSTCTGTTCMAWVEEFELVETSQLPSPEGPGLQEPN